MNEFIIRLNTADVALTNLADEADLGTVFEALMNIAQTAIDAAREIALDDEKGVK